MATSKAKRTVPLAQLGSQHSRHSTNPKTNPEPTALMPVKAHAYRAMAELNGGFEKVILDLQTLGQISYFHSERVTAMHDLICRVRA